VKVSLFARKGSASKGSFALESAALLLNFYNDYFGVSYPLPKLDLIAAPGSGGFSAMENWGAILYFENALLIDPNLTTEADRQRIFVTVAHELAHQWFGNLVTMEWWDNLWLNEGFASWMENKATDHFHPEWMMWLQSEAARQRAMRQDSKNTTHPIVQPVATGEQADQAFDDITYRKGQAVIRMLETYVGEEIFSTGVQAYMKRYAYRNAVTEDLWAEIEGAGSKKITGIADDYTKQPGVPLVTVDSVVPDGNHVTLALKQGRFCAGEGGCDPLVWHTPVSAASVGTKAPVSSGLISGPEPGSLTVEGGLPVKINVGQTSYYRSQYRKEAFPSLAEQFWTLTPADQLGLLYDMWALGEAGTIPVSDYLDLTRETSSGAETVIWQQIIETFASIDTLYTDPARQAAFRAYGCKILIPVFGPIGWDAVPGQADNIAILREDLIRTLGRFGEQAILNEARRRFDAFVANPNDPRSLPAAIRRPTLRTVALWADRGVYDAIHDLAVSATDPLEKGLLFTSLASAKDPELAKRSLDIALGDEPEKTMTPLMIARVAIDNPDLAWQFAIGHLDQLNSRLDAMQRYSFVPSIAAQSTNPDRLDDLRRFVDEQIPADTRPQVERFYADLAYRLNVKEQRLPQIDQCIGTQEGADELIG